jgi:NADH dehydrogenase
LPGALASAAFALPPDRLLIQARGARLEAPPQTMNEPNRIRLDVAILGGGFAGVYCARALLKESRAGKPPRTGLISEENHMVFQPMLPEVVGASLSPRHIVNPLRLLCRGAEILRGRVKQILWPDRRLFLHAGDFSGDVEVTFEHLVLAMGSAVDLSPIAGMPEHSFLMRNVGDAMLLRATMISRIEEASLVADPEVRKRLLTFVVVGGGFSGVETAGQILDFLRGVPRYYTSVSATDLQVYLVHSRDHLLPEFDRGLGEYTARKLEERGLHLVLNERVQSVTAKCVSLRSGAVIETNTVISTVGNAPHPLVLQLCKENDLAMEKGRIATEASCLVRGTTHLWAAGDCAAVPHVDGGICPDTAQFAMRQGALMGRNIARAYRREPLEPFSFKGVGQLAAIGHRTAVAHLKGLRFSGFVAWWLWRTVYLAKLPGLDRKLRVMLEWSLDLFFPRDITLLSPRYTRVFKEMYLEPGGILFHPGDPAFSLYIVKKGLLEVRDGERVIQVLGPGDYVGERALLNDRVWHFEGRALEPSLLVAIPAETFLQIVHGTGSLGRLFRKSAAKYQSRDVLQAFTGRLPPEILGRSAAEVMVRDLIVLRPEMSLREVIERVRQRPHSAYPVVGEDDRILGVVQREDLYEFIKDLRVQPETPLGEMPLTSLPVTGPEAPVGAVIERVLRSGGSKMLVAGSDGRLLGMITLMDLVAEKHKAESVEGPVN